MMSWTNAASHCSIKSSPDTFLIGKATSSRVSIGSVATAHPEDRQDASVDPSIDDGVAKPVTCADRDLRHQQDKDETEPVHCSALSGSWAASMAHAFTIEDRGLRPSMKGPLSRGLAGGNSPPVGSLIQAAAVLPLFRCANHRTCDRAFVLGWRLPSGVGRVFA